MSALGRDREIQWPFGRDRLVALAVIAAGLAAMILPELGYVPLWDGRVYANCVFEAAFSGVTMESLRCANHPSQGWAAVMVVPQLFSPGNVALLHATNLMLGVVAAGAFRVVLARAFPDPSVARELDLVCAAAAWQPVVVSTLLQPNVDFGVYAFFFVALAGLLSPGRPGTAAALAGGTLLVFSKETGVAAYAFAVAAALFVAYRRDRRPLGAQAGTLFRRAALLSLPVVLFVAHVVSWNASHGSSAIWKHGWQRSTADGFTFFDLSDPIFVSYAAGLFVLGFMWVAWAPVAIDGLYGLVAMARRRASRPVPGADPAMLPALVTMTIVLAYVLTSFRTWSNLRYFAVLFPLFLMLTYVSLRRLGVPARARRAGLGVLVALLVVADYRSVDPLSRAVYGTFDTGVRRMYRMSSITGEFDGPGRDQLVYNLEFTGYHHVQNALFERLHPTDSTVIATARQVRWNIWSQLEVGTWRRTMRRDHVFSPVYADEVDVAARGSPEAWFLDFSNRGYADHAMATLLPRYAVTDSMVVESRGQRLVARHLVRQESPVLP
jgi:hypothetical protein